ncbi:MAG: hypothetical protein SangKO_057870 [Sandaracinaceae bacterium]
MSDIEALLRDVMTRALGDLEQQGMDVYTFSFYLDHESRAVSVCADTRESSARLVGRSNAFANRYFLGAVRDGDLETAALWQANVGRSLSLGDFAAVNVARTELGRHRPTPDLCLAMVESVIENHDAIRKLSSDPAQTILTCSTLDDEVGLVWSLPAEAP